MGAEERRPARAALIEAAASLCAERGYGGFGEAEIAARAGISPARAGEIFPGGAEEIVAAAQDAVLLELLAAVSRSYSADRSELESVIHGIKAILEQIAARPSFAYVGYIASRQGGSASLRESNRTAHRMLEAMLERGWDYSSLPEQPAKVALAVLGGAQALVRRELIRGDPERVPELLPDCVYFTTVPFLGCEEALRLTRQARALLAAERQAAPPE
jgi:AcrR family transcriptional regulator